MPISPGEMAAYSWRSRISAAPGIISCARSKIFNDASVRRLRHALMRIARVKPLGMPAGIAREKRVAASNRNIAESETLPYDKGGSRLSVIIGESVNMAGAHMPVIIIKLCREM